MLTYRENRGKENREKMEQKERKKWKRKVENWKWKEEKLKKEVRTFFFFSRLSLFKTTEICFGSTKMGIFYQEKPFHAGKKIRKNDFAPSEKYACYAPAKRGCSAVVNALNPCCMLDRMYRWFLHLTSEQNQTLDWLLHWSFVVAIKPDGPGNICQHKFLFNPN